MTVASINEPKQLDLFGFDSFMDTLDLPRPDMVTHGPYSVANAYDPVVGQNHPAQVAPTTDKLITIRENSDYNADMVEVLEGSRTLGIYSMSEMNPHKLAELLRWFGHPVRKVEYMFEHDIAEFG